ncbi:MAG TPA: cation transporter [Dehalococcoidia bacterium]|nr:cation transporter [Dehalococcoidia bacterium]
MFATRSGAARLALGTVIVLIAVKVIVAIVTGSISITAQAMDSALDLIAVIVTFFAIRIAMMPADKEHPFGHAKAEGIAAIIQAVLIVGAGSFIAYSAIRRIIDGATVEMTEAGIGVMLFSMVVSILLARHLHRVSRTTQSLALEASARNITADIYSAAGVLLAMIIIRFTGLVILDPIIALGVTALIFKSAYDVIRESVRELADVRLPEEEEQILTSTINEHRDQLSGFHSIRSRKAGDQRFIDLHLVMPRNATLEEAHAMCDHLEEDIRKKLSHTSVTIHCEPCRMDCRECFVISCSLRRQPSGLR